MTGIIILAAGQSSRMGTPKQQLQFNGTTLLQHTITTAAASDAELVVVVLGYMAEALRPVATQSNVHIAINENWQEGMASSIRQGINELIKTNLVITQAIIMVADQPLVTTALLNMLMQKKATDPAGIVACAYAGTVGVPALFERSYFTELGALQGETGAKKILQKFQGDVVTIVFAGGETDIDTRDDLERLIGN